MQIVSNDSGKLLNMDETAAMLGIRKSTLYSLCMRREISCVKIGKLNRFRPEELQAFISKNVVEVRE